MVLILSNCFFDIIGFLLGCMLGEVGLDIVIDLFLPPGRVVVPQRHRGETLIKNSQRGKGLPVCARRLLGS